MSWPSDHEDEMRRKDDDGLARAVEQCVAGRQDARAQAALEEMERRLGDLRSQRDLKEMSRQQLIRTVANLSIQRTRLARRVRKLGETVKRAYLALGSGDAYDRIESILSDALNIRRCGCGEEEWCRICLTPPWSDGVSEPVYIWSGEHGMYWKDNSRGYTNDRSKAGVYSREAAERIIENAGPSKALEIHPVRGPADENEDLEDPADFIHLRLKEVAGLDLPRKRDCQSPLCGGRQVAVAHEVEPWEAAPEAQITAGIRFEIVYDCSDCGREDRVEAETVIEGSMPEAWRKEIDE